MIGLLQGLILDGGERDVEGLMRESEGLRAEICEIERKVERVVLRGEESLGGDAKLDRILAVLAISEEELAEERRVLGQQSAQIQNLVSYIQRYLSQQSTQPRALSNKIKQLKKIVEESQKQNYPTPQSQKLQTWTTKLIESLQKRLCDLVSVFTTYIRIKVDEIACYKDLLNEQICREFVRLLYRDLITYDVPTFSYVLMLPGEERDVEGTVVVQREAVIFTCEKAEMHYGEIRKSILESYRLCRMLAGLFGQSENSFHKCILDQIEKSQENVKAQIEYILPYLSLQKRKELIQTLCTKSESESTLYDILVRLRIKGQDGEMMASNTRQLIEKLKTGGKGAMDEVVVFLEICESQDKSLNIGFYICNELINSLEGHVDYDEIERLLVLREEMRFRIHHPV